MELWRHLFADESMPARLVSAGLLGLVVGTLLTRWVARLITAAAQPGMCPRCGQLLSRRTLWLSGWYRVVCPSCHAALPAALRLIPWVTALAFTGYVFAVVDLGGQTVTQVTPDEFWRYGRVVCHLVLIGLLIVAAATDLFDCTIADEVVWVGLVFGVASAGISGDLQMVHLWFDWNREEIFKGAYIPQWIVDHHHLHGLAWSLAGAATGFGAIWLVRWLSGLVLRQPALGLGDATLMAMVGSFLGWQPVCCALLLAPLCAIVAGATAAILTGRTYIPFGPYLCLATWLVLCGWRWLWNPTRYIFGHVPSLLGLVGGSLATLVIMLVVVRAYRAIPTNRDRHHDSSGG